jgi:uncharacterized membrane protein
VANLHLLFWLSLVPFATAWMGESHWEAIPTAVYGIVLLCDAIAYTILVRTIFAHEGRAVAIARGHRQRHQGQHLAPVLSIAIPLAFVHPLIAQANLRRSCNFVVDSRSQNRAHGS